VLTLVITAATFFIYQMENKSMTIADFKWNPECSWFNNGNKVIEHLDGCYVASDWDTDDEEWFDTMKDAIDWFNAR